MSVEEQPMENSDAACDVTDAASPAADISSTSDKRRIVRDTLVAGGILLISALAVGLYFHFSRRDTNTGAEPTVSASAWIQPEPDDNAAVPPSAVGQLPTIDPSPENALDTETETAESDDSPLPSAGDDKNTRTGIVKSGVPVIAGLQKLGLTLQQAHAIITALRGIFDFRKSHPGDTFELRMDDANQPVYFAYHVSLTEVYEVEKRENGLKGKKKHIPTTIKERRFGGTIASSLYKTLSDLNANPSLAGKIVGVLANEVNFYKEQRPGDTFRVIVEEESLDGTFLGYGPVVALEYNGVKSGKKRFFRLEAPGRESEYFNEKGISQPRSVIAIPLHYTRISSPFGKRYHPVLKRRMDHNGVDFAAGTGEPVWACQEGIVTIAGPKGANGNLVGIRHPDGLESYYAHLYRFGPGIKVGVAVKKRQVIGSVGNTGRSTGPHLHFGLKKNGKFVDPLKYRVQPGRPVEAKYRPALNEIIQSRGQLLDRTPIVPASEPLAEAPDGEGEVLGVEDW